MAPYIPQNAHYAHVDVCEYYTEDIYKFMGKGGRRFYNLTHKLNLKYLWFNTEIKVIEIWASYESMLNNPIEIIKKDLIKFMSKIHIGQTEDGGVQTN